MEHGYTLAEVNEFLKKLYIATPKKYIGKDPSGNDYVTARYVMNLLDTIVGPAYWTDSYKVVDVIKRADGTARITVECTLNVLGVTKTDTGYGELELSKKDSLYGNYEKEAYSIALKRAAVKFGIARDLYNDGMPRFETEVAEVADPKAPEQVERPARRPRTVEEQIEEAQALGVPEEEIKEAFGDVQEVLKQTAQTKKVPKRVQGKSHESSIKMAIPADDLPTADFSQEHINYIFNQLPAEIEMNGFHFRNLVNKRWPDGVKESGLTFGELFKQIQTPSEEWHEQHEEEAAPHWTTMGQPQRSEFLKFYEALGLTWGDVAQAFDNGSEDRMHFALHDFTGSYEEAVALVNAYQAVQDAA